VDDSVDIIVSGHLCIDLIPDMRHVTREALTMPGHLSETGAMVVSTGGSASNTGLSLFRLGVKVGLMGTVGEDLVGQMIIGYLSSHSPDLTRFVVVRTGQPSSYTIALSPLGADRTFLHCPATNDTFGAEDIDFNLVAKAKIFHLGYPALMARLREDEGAEVRKIFERAKATGVVTSLDMARPDPATASGRVNWLALMRKTLPFVDIFVPSIEETLFMMRRADFDRWHGDVLAHISLEYLREIASELLDMGAVIVGFKLGEMGLYLRAADASRFERLACLRLPVDEWANAEVWLPAFQVDVAGTTGAGDSAYAGLLAALLHDYGPEEAARWANAVGACNVEAPDSNSGIRSWEETGARIAAGWRVRPDVLPDHQL
jgi:sugar/nucleoside kinase (ribokinase family)